MSGIETSKIRVAVVTLSTRVALGEREDLGGAAVVEAVENANMRVRERKVIADQKQELIDYLTDVCLRQKADIILTTGGTGLSRSDITPEATLQVIEKRLTGLEFGMFRLGLKKTPFAMLSRAVAGTCQKTIIVNLPGNPKGAVENLSAIIKALPHAVRVLQAEQISDEEHKPVGS